MAPAPIYASCSNEKREAIKVSFFFFKLLQNFLASLSSILSLAAAKQQGRNPRSPVHFKRVPASKRRKFGEGGKISDVIERATYAVLTFRHSEDTLKALGITPLKQRI